MSKIVVKEDTNEVIIDGESHIVSPLPFKLLVFFVNNNGKTISRSTIIDNIWDNGAVTNRSVDVAVGKLRKIHESINESIKTVVNRGYNFSNNSITILNQKNVKSKKIRFEKIAESENGDKYAVYYSGDVFMVMPLLEYEGKYGSM